MTIRKDKPLISVVMGSKSDLEIMDKAANILRDMMVPFELDIVSAHRTPRKMFDFAESLEERGIMIVIAGAGGAAHLPGMIASLTMVPVIGVPISATKLTGVDALLSIAQMPAGIPVATVAIDNAENAGLLALQILGTTQKEVADKLRAYRSNLRKKVEIASKTVRDF